MEEYLEHRNIGYDEKTLVPESFFRENYEEGNTKVLDEGTSHAIQIDDLSKLVYNGAVTKTGKVIVDYSIRNPFVPINLINAKHEALDEIRANDKIRKGIRNVLERVKKYEGIKKTSGNVTGAIGFLSGKGDLYETQSDIRTILGSLPEWAKDIPEPESAYLKGLVNDINTNLRHSSVHKVAKGPIFRHLTKGKIYGLEEVLKEHTSVSPLPFNPIPTQIIPTFIGFATPPATAIYVVANTNGLTPEHGLLLTLFGTIGTIVGGMMGAYIGHVRDNYNFLRPMERRFRNDAEAIRAYESIGCLDELLAYDEFRRKLPNASLPKILDTKEHEFFAEGLVNPLQSQRIDNYIPNNVVLNNEQRLTFLTGPNSGGKTSLGKSIAQTQVLAQIGCYVPATDARISIADKIFYQVGRNDSLDDNEGGLGTQFKETKKVLFSSTPKSLVVVDDLIEGTTFNEKTRHTMDQLYGFLHKGPNVVYVSHHFELAKHFQDRGIGNFWQVEFDGEKPTHKIIPGISTNSRSDLVAERVGISQKDIIEHLQEKGCLTNGQNLRDVSIYTRKGSEE